MSMRRLVFIHLGEVGLAAAAAWGANYLFDDLAADLLFGVGTLLTLELITLSLLWRRLAENMSWFGILPKACQT